MITTLKKPRKMTLKQERWTKGYIETGNATEAARRARYEASNPHSLNVIGSENLIKLDKDIEKARDKEGLTWLTPEYILTSLNRIAISKKAPFRAKISALELLGKSLALFTDKVETQNKIIGIIGELKSEWREQPLIEPKIAP